MTTPRHLGVSISASMEGEMKYYIGITRIWKSFVILILSAYWCGMCSGLPVYWPYCCWERHFRRINRFINLAFTCSTCFPHCSLSSKIIPRILWCFVTLMEVSLIVILGVGFVVFLGWSLQKCMQQDRVDQNRKPLSLVHSATVHCSSFWMNNLKSECLAKVIGVTVSNTWPFREKLFSVKEGFQDQLIKVTQNIIQQWIFNKTLKLISSTC
jgi:hypothetical protein